ncbi:MAG TPA: response regulator transcription factor [Solimonas sp.]
MSGKSRVLVVEDDADTRERLSRAVAADPDLALCGQAGSCAEARRAFAAQQPQVVLIDLGLPDGHGAALIRELSAQDSSVLFMVITVFGDEAHVIEAIAAGASSYLLKDASAPQVARAIREMLAGGSPISPGVARYLLQRLQAPAAPKAPDTAADPATRLSARESDVLNLVAKGYAYAEIGAALDISVNTVGSHVKQIYRKLAVRSRGEAVFEAIQRGLIGDLSGR